MGVRIQQANRFDVEVFRKYRITSIAIFVSYHVFKTKEYDVFLAYLPSFRFDNKNDARYTSGEGSAANCTVTYVPLFTMALAN